MSQKKNSLIRGVSILGIAGMLAKVIGMVFRIQLSDMLQADGIAIYQTVYNNYTTLLAISTAGIPVAISRLVAENVTVSRYGQAKTVLRSSMALLAALGALLTLALVLLADPLARAIGAPQSALGFRAIAPSIFIVSIMSALRGYMQGRTRMTPTAVSQLIEQVGKILVSFPLAAYGMRTQGPVHAAAYALLGISIGEGIALLYMAVTYRLFMRKNKDELAMDVPGGVPRGKLMREIIRIALPITLGSMIVPLAGSIDTAMIRARLAVAGIEMAQREVLYGLLTGYVLSLINVPTVLATAVCISLVPIISAARIDNRIEDMHRTSLLGLRLASLIGFPCAVGMSLLSTPIIHLIYASTPMEHVVIAGDILQISAWTILLFAQVQASTGVLQGAGLHKIPVYSLLAGVVAKVALNYVLIAIPGLNIFGAPIASLCCYAISMAVNIFFIVRKTGMRFEMDNIVVRPALATVGMGAVVLILKRVLNMYSRSQLMLVILAAVLVYAILVFVFGALKQADMDQMPGGRKIEKLFIKLHIWQ